MRTLRGRTLTLFGSALRDDFDPGSSDLDFCVDFQTTTHNHAERYLGLLDGLEDLFERRVDLVDVGAVRDPYLRREIEEQRWVWLEAAVVAGPRMPE